MLRKARAMANSARDELRTELGPEYSDLELRDLDPRNIVRKHIIEAMEDEDDRPPRRSRSSPRASSRRTTSTPPDRASVSARLRTTRRADNQDELGRVARSTPPPEISSTMPASHVLACRTLVLLLPASLLLWSGVRRGRRHRRRHPCGARPRPPRSTPPARSRSACRRCPRWSSRDRGPPRPPGRRPPSPPPSGRSWPVARSASRSSAASPGGTWTG